MLKISNGRIRGSAYPELTFNKKPARQSQANRVRPLERRPADACSRDSSPERA